MLIMTVSLEPGIVWVLQLVVSFQFPVPPNQEIVNNLLVSRCSMAAATARRMACSRHPRFVILAPFVFE
jgi:hypothetical protein